MLAFLLVSLPTRILGTNTSEWRVVSWNVENYLPVHRHIEGRFHPDYPKPETEKAALRVVIHRWQPDLFLIQEMGSEPYLKELQQDLAREGWPMPYRAWVQAQDTQRHLAALGRIPWEKAVGHSHLDFAYRGGREIVRRGTLELRFQEDRQSWSLWNVHLKSRWTEHEDDPQAAVRRAREARTIRDLILGRAEPPAESIYLVMGDFNDYPNSAALRAFQRRGPLDFASRLTPSDSRGHIWTHFWARESLYSVLDHAVASHSFAEFFEIVEVRIIDDPEVESASDHRPLFLRFRLRN